MATVADIQQVLQSFAPIELAESWDNVGLLVGDPAHNVHRGMTCLTLTQSVAEEALHQAAQLVVTHHPLPFRPLARITTDHHYGRVLWQLIRGGIAVYSAHTAFDSAAQGINQQLAERLRLNDIRPLAVHQLDRAPAGVGRCGALEESLSGEQFVRFLKSALSLSNLQWSACDAAKPIRRVAIACGSGGSFWERAAEADCQVLVTGDIGFHQALEASAAQLAVAAIGHFVSERFAMENLATYLGEQFPECTWWASQRDRDPFQWL